MCCNYEASFTLRTMMPAYLFLFIKTKKVFDKYNC